MKVVYAKNKFPKIQITQAQELKVREVLNCTHRPTQYAGGIMYAQGGGWYEVSSERTWEDWATDEQMQRALIRKIRKIIKVEDEVLNIIDYSKPNVGKRHCDTGKPIYVKVSRNEQAVLDQFTKPEVKAAPLSRLEALQRRLNNRFHRA